MEIEGKAQELAFQEAKLQLTRERDEEILGSELFIQLVSEKRQMLLASKRTSHAPSERPRFHFKHEIMHKLEKFPYPPDTTSSSPERKSPKRKRSPAPHPSWVHDLKDFEGCEPS